MLSSELELYLNVNLPKVGGQVKKGVLRIYVRYMVSRETVFAVNNSHHVIINQEFRFIVGISIVRL